MIGFFRRLLKDRRGNALVIAGACLPMIIGAAGLANDTIQWTLWKRQLQRAADSAAIAGVYDRENASGSTSTVSATVDHDLTLNLHTWMTLKTGYPKVTYPSNSGSVTNQVQVSLAVQQKLPFSSLFMTAAPIITANATAAGIAAGDACMEAMEPTAVTGLTFSGNASIYMPDCDLFSNSPATNTSTAKGSSSVTANSVGGVGGIQQSNNFHVTSYRPYSPALPDPFAGVNPLPADMKCATKTQGSNTVPVALDENTDMAAMKTAGINCFSALSVGSSKALAVPADFGPIYINGGDAFVQGDFSCTGCTVVLTNKDASTTATIGQFKVNASSKINITAPTTGTFQGIAIYQDRRATNSNQTNKINGNSSSIVTGAIYFPSQEVDYNGTGTTSAVCTMFVARRLTFSGNSGTSNKFKKLSDCAGTGLPTGATYKMVRLVA